MYNGKEYVLEESLTADISLIKAYQGDLSGNLIYSHTARNFNPEAATAGKITIAEVDEIVETGSFDPNNIHTYGIYVQMVLQADCEKRIEQRTVKA